MNPVERIFPNTSWSTNLSFNPQPKPFKFGFFLGRFHHIHLGHEHVINKALELCENLLLLVGSAQESGTERNPFDTATRISLIKTIYQDRVKVGFIPDLTNENDESYEWGNYLLDQVRMWGSIYGIKDNIDLMVCGTDKNTHLWFDEDDIADISLITFSRSKIKVSATELRSRLYFGDELEWKKYTNPLIYNRYSELKAKLEQVLGAL
jgi:cytidyltransferase-like protein